MGVKRLDTMLPEQAGEVRVGHQVAARGYGTRDLSVHIPETVLFANHAAVRRGRQRLDVAGRLFMCQWLPEDRRVSRESLEVRRAIRAVAGWRKHFTGCGVSRRDIATVAEQIDRPFLRGQRDGF